jgi:hypothetical protein
VLHEKKLTKYNFVKNHDTDIKLKLSRLSVAVEEFGFKQFLIAYYWKKYKISDRNKYTHASFDALTKLQKD